MNRIREALQAVPKMSHKGLSIMYLLSTVSEISAFISAFQLQRDTVETFYGLANEYSSADCPAGPIPEGMLELKRNFFSTFFLGVIKLLVRNDTYMPLYAMVNHSMRAWVTACDNILDDEYKTIFDFEIDGQGSRMRSVLTLMLAERILVGFMLSRYDDPELIKLVEKESLHSLIPSALQECEEEGESITILSPEQVIRDVHQRKTADLFAAPLHLPTCLENPPDERIQAAESAVENFGLGCQIIDDIKDMKLDLDMGRHNLLRSLQAEKDPAKLDIPGNEEWTAWERFADVTDDARQMSQSYFERSFASLSELGMPLTGKQQEAIIGLMYMLLKVPRSR